MKRLLTLLLVVFMIPAFADSFLQSAPTDSVFGGSNATQMDFLPSEKAFHLEKKKVDEQGVHLQYIIADGYYLYKNRFSFKTDNPQVVIGELKLPKGKIKQDEFFGEIEAYHAILDIVVPVNNPNGQDFNLEVNYQGCAEKGLCYPMETAKFDVDGIVSAANVMAGTHDVATLPAVDTKKTTSQQDLTALSWATLLYYFGFGLLLSLTPCVFPMLPILAGIVLRGQVRRIRAIVLALVYILSMALTYAVFGVLVGLFGAELGLQARLQSPWVLIPFAVFFVIFALAMFGVFELRLPSFITQALDKASDKAHGGSVLGAAVLGVCSSLVVSPCVSAPFAGILLHISTTGDSLGGGISLFTLGLGMGVPLFVIAAGGSVLLPKAGTWMVVVRNAIGVMLLGVAIYLLSRIIPSYIALALWGCLAAGIAVFIGTFDFSQVKSKPQKCAQVIGLFLIVYAIAAWVGAFQGRGEPLQPLQSNFMMSASEIVKPLNWQVVNDQQKLNDLLEQAQKQGKLTMVDWTADWCTACVKMEHEVFQQVDVINALSDYQLIRIDLSNTTPSHRQLQNIYKVFGPPTILFFDKKGNELSSLRIVGEMSKKEFLRHLSEVSRYNQ